MVKTTGQRSGTLDIALQYVEPLPRNTQSVFINCLVGYKTLDCKKYENKDAFPAVLLEKQFTNVQHFNIYYSDLHDCINLSYKHPF